MPALQGLGQGPELTMPGGTINYRASGCVDYRFRFEWIPRQDSWRIYILEQPSYRSRATDMHSTHRLGLPHNPYVCWTDPLRTYEDALTIAALWADMTQRYIAIGAWDPPSSRRQITDRSVLAARTEQQLRAALTRGDNHSRPSTPSTPGPTQAGPIRRLLERIR